jgi:hypothetical protein
MFWCSNRNNILPSAVQILMGLGLDKLEQKAPPIAKNVRMGNVSGEKAPLLGQKSTGAFSHRSGAFPFPTQLSQVQFFLFDFFDRIRDLVTSASF